MSKVHICNVINEFLQRYPKVYAGTNIHLDGEVAKIISEDGERYEIVLWLAQSFTEYFANKYPLDQADYYMWNFPEEYDPYREQTQCYTIAVEQTAVEVENHEPFGAKWSMFCRLKVRSYVLAANVAGTLKVAPLQILKFPVVLPHKFLDAEKFNLRFSDASEITEIADKLRWYRYQKGLRQRDAADYAGIDRSTYIHYEEAGRDFYPKEHMEKLAELFEVPLENLLDDYNLFLLRGQGAQIKAIRQRQGLTQKAYAAQLGVPLQKFKRWEQGSVQIFKATWERYFKQRNFKPEDRLMAQNLDFKP